VPDFTVRRPTSGLQYITRDAAGIKRSSAKHQLWQATGDMAGGALLPPRRRTWRKEKNALHNNQTNRRVQRATTIFCKDVGDIINLLRLLKIFLEPSEAVKGIIILISKEKEKL